MSMRGIFVVTMLLASSNAKQINGIDQTEAVVAELSSFVNEVVDPSIRLMEANESNSNSPHDCFSTAAGRVLRSRCCVYFSNVAGSLIEAKFGKLKPPRAVNLDLSDNEIPPLSLTYQLMAKWLLANPNDPLAIGVRAEKIRSIDEMHEKSKTLPGPTGRYEAKIIVAGVPGTLVKCEMGSTHTFLVFQSDNNNLSKDVIIDVTYQQFLVITEWMDTRVEELALASEKTQYFNNLPKFMVGTDDDISEIFTIDGLKSEMDRIVKAAGYSSSDRSKKNGNKKWGTKPWKDRQQLENMHHLRNNVMMSLNNPETRRKFCGLPNQAIDANPSIRDRM